MTTTPQPEAGLVKLTGTITHYRCARAEASFVFTDSDRTALGVVAIAAGIAGLSGQAIATAANATATEEEADYVEFELDGKPVKGWVWRSPFKEGDQVEVVAEWRDDHYETAGIARPVDRIVALYPHCSRGKARHIKNAVKWWFFGVLIWLVFIAFLVFLTAEDFLPTMATGFHYAALGSYAFFGLMTISLARKWMPFVRLAQKVFATLGWPNPGEIDLVKTSKAQRKPGDPGEYGTFYFRY
ncbi:hypothetical protein J2W23_005575 [Variovorax boronicumulans]|uniref:putative type VI secretion system effector n=1 Tax=Variovorax boronicumulans TaxID=436515 RepID=UPI002789BA30|nr:putative type VI secretion system effector [Variovorax boronicumulans]MDQ0017166.1 hypothetical protein [Variovorax boronicumulans]